jgi:uncharacterized protein
VVLPDDPVTMAWQLVREFQRVKLGAVLDLYDLFDPEDKPLQAPGGGARWPLEGLLEETYANLAVTEFWRVRAGLGEHDQAEAAERYEHWREHTAAAIDILAGSGSLTELGRYFVGQMRISMTRSR